MGDERRGVRYAIECPTPRVLKPRPRLPHGHGVRTAGGRRRTLPPQSRDAMLSGQDAREDDPGCTQYISMSKKLAEQSTVYVRAESERERARLVAVAVAAACSDS